MYTVYGIPCVYARRTHLNNRGGGLLAHMLHAADGFDLFRRLLPKGEKLLLYDCRHCTMCENRMENRSNTQTTAAAGSDAGGSSGARAFFLLRCMCISILIIMNSWRAAQMASRYDARTLHS